MSGQTGMPTLTRLVMMMKRQLTIALPLFGFIALIVSGPNVLAGKPPEPVASETPLHSGAIDFLDLRHGVIVINDMEYAISNKLTVNGKNTGARQNLRKGMRIKFTFSIVTSQSRPVVDEIWLGQ
jgi:hypothetical protein